MTDVVMQWDDAHAPELTRPEIGLGFFENSAWRKVSRITYGAEAVADFDNGKLLTGKSTQGFL